MAETTFRVWCVAGPEDVKTLTAMAHLLSLIDPLRHAAQVFFRHDLKLQRDEAGLRVVLKEKPASRDAAPRKPSRHAELTPQQREELLLIRHELTALLDERPETRRTLRALCVVEDALTRKGLRALQKLPLDVLRLALDQFESLVTNWSPVGLATLRSKMAVAVIERDRLDPESEADAYRTSAVMDPEPGGILASDPQSGAEEIDDDAALAAAYAAIGQSSPAGVEMQTELGSPSAKAVAQAAVRATVRGSAA